MRIFTVLAMEFYKHIACVELQKKNISLLFVLRNENNWKMYGKIQIITRRFRTRLHASNFGIQFFSRNIKVFIS